jgi:ElaB/YqjD/DUF883 family membrane-anchored ribosome-binding protein
MNGPTTATDPETTGTLQETPFAHAPQTGGQPASGGSTSGGAGSSSSGSQLREAGDQARGVMTEGKQQLRSLTGDARRAVQDRVQERSSQVATTLSDLADDLEAMAGSTQSDGPLPKMAGQAATAVRNTADRLQQGGVQGMADDVRRFARERPGVFLGIAFGMGIVAGRLLRGDIDDHRDSGDGVSDEIDLRSTYPADTSPLPGAVGPGEAPATAGLVAGGPTTATGGASTGEVLP